MLDELQTVRNIHDQIYNRYVTGLGVLLGANYQLSLLKILKQKSNVLSGTLHAKGSFAGQLFLVTFLRDSIMLLSRFHGCVFTRNRTSNIQGALDAVFLGHMNHFEAYRLKLLNYAPIKRLRAKPTQLRSVGITVEYGRFN